MIVLTMNFKTPSFFLLSTLFIFNTFSNTFSIQEIDDEFMWPTSGVVSSEWGPRYGEFHDGIDITCRRGNEIYAAQAGIVKTSKRNRRLGHHVVIDHLNGYKTVYGHGDRRLVEKGQRVEKGDALIECGSTGLSTGPHLHLEVLKKNKKINPRKVFHGNP